MLKVLLAKVRHWYEGDYIVYENPPDAVLVFIGGSYRRHWTASVARALVAFWLEHWKWTIGTTIAVVGLIAAFMRLR